MHIVADFSHLSGQGYQMSICSLGLMGTEYVYDTDPPPASADVSQMQTSTLSISNIKSALSIGNTLDPRVRQKQGSGLSWATIIQGIAGIQIQLSPQASVAPGAYTLFLEYYDNNSSVGSILKSHTIALTVKKQIIRDTPLPTSFEIIARQPG